jgi:hypothetical protein
VPIATIIIKEATVFSLASAQLLVLIFSMVYSSFGFGKGNI